MGTVLTSHPPFAEGLCRTGKGIEESTMILPRGPVDQETACRDTEQ